MQLEAYLRYLIPTWAMWHTCVAHNVEHMWHTVAHNVEHNVAHMTLADTKEQTLATVSQFSQVGCHHVGTTINSASEEYCHNCVCDPGLLVICALLGTWTPWFQEVFWGVFWYYDDPQGVRGAEVYLRGSPQGVISSSGGHLSQNSQEF